MPMIKVDIAIYGLTFAETLHREEFIVGKGEEPKITRGLGFELFTKMVKVFAAFNRGDATNANNETRSEG